MAAQPVLELVTSASGDVARDPHNETKRLLGDSITAPTGRLLVFSDISRGREAGFK